MRKLYSLFFLIFAFSIAAQAQPNHLVISQVYGGGGNSNATYKNDFVEIFNPTASSVNLTDWTIQYQPAGSSTWLVDTIPAGSVAPGKYFLVMLAGGATGVDLPTPDASPTFPSNLSGSNGKVALVNSLIALTACTDPSIVDKIGYGTTSVACNETANATSPSANTNSMLRVNNGCTDTDNNSTDFAVGVVNPRNTASPTNNCSASSISTGTVATTPFCIDAATGATGTVAFTATGTYNTTFTAYLSDASGNFAAPVNIGSTAVNGTAPSGTVNITIPAGTASGTGYKIRVDATSPAVTGTASSAFEIINGAKNVFSPVASSGNLSAIISWSNPTTCFDDVLIVAKAGGSISGTPAGDGSAYTAGASYGDGTAFDGGFVVYKGTTSPQTITGLTNGTTYHVKIFSRRGTNWSSGVEVTVTPAIPAAPGEIVINQFSPDYAGASDEYIELVNKTTKSFDLSGYAIKYQSASGAPGGAGGNLSGTLMSKQFWLLSPNATVTAGLTNGLARDGAITAGFSATAGQIALVRLSDNVVIDAVGYGTITAAPPAYTEGTPAPAPPVDGGLKRTTNGGDTNDNLTDFSTVANANILLHNSTSAPLPVKFANIKATQKAAGIQLSWSNMTESGVLNYVVERSANGREFAALAQIAPTGNADNRSDYSYFDGTPFRGTNFYRIKSVEASGKVVYSTVVKINPAANAASLSVYPNPVSGNTALLQLSNLPAGAYRLRIVNTIGQVVRTSNYVHNGGSVNEELPLGTLGKGLYTVQVSGPVLLQQQFIKQ